MNAELEVQAARPLVMVDDNPGDLRLARSCMIMSRLTNPWREFPGGPPFLTYLEEVKSGSEEMPALVLLDLNMPGMNGLEVLEAVRKEPEFAEVPIFLVFTSSTDPRDRSRALSLGARGYQVKPGEVDAYVEFFNRLAPD